MFAVSSPAPAIQAVQSVGQSQLPTSLAPNVTPNDPPAVAPGPSVSSISPVTLTPQPATQTPSRAQPQPSQPAPTPPPAAPAPSPPPAVPAPPPPPPAPPAPPPAPPEGTLYYGAGLPSGQFMNAQSIYQSLRGAGLTPYAASGVAGNIYQESHGDPSIGSSAGGGLFGETLANGGAVNGGSLQEQLTALYAYIAANGSIADINANAGSATQAADYFCNHYERPGIPALSVREAAAQWVASQGWN